MTKSLRTLQVKQVGNSLVAAFETADPPLVWKFDLERNHSFAIALQGGDGDWKLGVSTTGKDDFHSVARFRSRDEAEEAFEKTQDALMRTSSGGGAPGGWRVATIGLVAILVLLGIFIVTPMVMFAHALGGHNPGIGGNSSASASVTQPGKVPDGVPMDADKVLKPPAE